MTGLDKGWIPAKNRGLKRTGQGAPSSWCIWPGCSTPPSWVEGLGSPCTHSRNWPTGWRWCLGTGGWVNVGIPCWLRLVTGGRRHLEEKITHLTTKMEMTPDWWE